MYCSVLLTLGGTDLLVILVVALMLFGGDKLPEIARTVGKGIRDFKDASEDVKREINNQINLFEEKKAEGASAIAATQPALPPASEETIATAEEPVTEEHNIAETETPAVPNTVPLGDNHSTVTGNHTSTETEPIKTT
jgi:sec-independent protein translocase protein TatA